MTHLIHLAFLALIVRNPYGGASVWVWQQVLFEELVEGRDVAGVSSEQDQLWQLAVGQGLREVSGQDWGLGDRDCTSKNP